MQWCCPHCGVTLAVPYDTLGTGWSFSRCYKCGGFALIRRAEVNIIKVDKAPPGEKVILPEAGTDPTAGLLNEEAAQKFAKHTSKIKAEKPTIKPARTHLPPPPPGNILKFDELERLNLETEAFEQNAIENKNFRGARKHAIPFGIVVAAVLAMGSGIYLYVEGQSAYQKVSSTTRDRALPRKPSEMASNEPGPEGRGVPRFDDSSTSGNLDNPENTQTRSKNPPRTEDKLVTAQKLVRPVIPSENPTITDQVQESAMAPIKSATTNTPSAYANMLVQTRLKRASLHGGPGMQFPVTGIANPDIRYVVADWKDRWFKIALNTSGTLSDVGWIRNDLVQIMPSTFLGNAVPNVNPPGQ